VAKYVHLRRVRGPAQRATAIASLLNAAQTNRTLRRQQQQQQQLTKTWLGKNKVFL
jgi:hypothetical protein